MRSRIPVGLAIGIASCWCAWLVASGSPSAIVDAAMQGDRATVERLLQAGSDVNAVQGDGMTALHWAAWHGQAELARAILAHGANVRAATELGGYTPLHLAAETGSAAVVEMLIAHGAEVDARTRTGATPLMLAAGLGDVASVEALLKAGARPNTTESARGQTALMFAAAAGRGDAVKLLLKNGADPNLMTTVVDLTALSRNGVNPDGRNLPKLNPAVQKEKKGEARKRPVGLPGVNRSYYENELVAYQGGMTPLLFAVRQGYADIVTTLLDAGVDVNQPKGGDRSSPLLVAAVNGQFDIGKMLLERGADPNLASDAGVTPLYATINLQWAPHSYYPQPRAQFHQETNYLEFMKLLLDKGADPNARLERKVWYTSYNSDLSGVDETGATPFWRAAYGADVDAMKLLVRYGADPNIATMKTAGRALDPDAVGPAGGESTGKDFSGVPPVAVGGPGVPPILAASGEAYGWSFTANSHRYAPTGMLAAVRYLVDELHADVNARDADGNTPLHNAASRGDNDMVKFLVSKGADVTALNRKGQTVADMANGPFQRTQPFPETIALLVKLGAKVMHKCVSC